MNEVALRANDVLRNDVMLRINEVALRTNEYALALMIYKASSFFVFLRKSNITLFICTTCVRKNALRNLNKKQKTQPILIKNCCKLLVKINVFLYNI